MNSGDGGTGHRGRRPVAVPDLEQVLQQQQSSASIASGKLPDGGNRTTSEKSLQQVLAEAGGLPPGVATPLKDPPPDSRARPLSNTLDQAGTEDSTEGRNQEKQAQRHDRPLPTLDSVLNPGRQTVDVGRRTREATGHSAEPAGFEDAVRKVISTGGEATGKRTTSNRAKFVAIALGGLVVATAVGILFRPPSPTPNSETARRLLIVAEDIAQYRARNHKLPEKLIELPRFPADAVAWPIEDYAVQLATPKLEFFFTDVPGGYIVIARLAEEVWVYDTTRSQPLRREFSH